MAGWDEIIGKLNNSPPYLDICRDEYLTKLSEVTGRNVIAYYSAFLTKNEGSLDLSDLDMNGFMNALRGMDCSRGLDLILHTPGGSPVAAEAIVSYLRSKFNKDIRVIVPQLAMSAGTMIACSGKSIVLGKQSSLGPIDPQFNGIPAYNIINELESAKSDLAKNPENIHYWSIQLSKYPAAFVHRADEAIQLSSELLKNWLGTCMFDSNSDNETIDKIVGSLNEHDKSKEHGRHYNIDFCKEIGLRVETLEDDNNLQDAVLSVHHIFMIMLNNTDVTKVIQSVGKPWLMRSSN